MFAYADFREWTKKIVEYNDKSLKLANLLCSDVNFIDEMISGMVDLLFKSFNISMSDAAYEAFWQLVCDNHYEDEKSWNDFYKEFVQD